MTPRSFPYVNLQQDCIIHYVWGRWKRGVETWWHDVRSHRLCRGWIDCELRTVAI